MVNVKRITSEIPSFAREIEAYLDELGILEGARKLEADHIGLRVKNAEDVSRLKAELGTQGKLLSSAMVNGREICIFELDKPLQVGGWTIPCVELPFPKANHPYEDGVEHIELVIPSSAETLDQMRENFKNFFPGLDTQSLQMSGQYSESLPASETEQLPNPTIELRKRIGLTVKFHANSIKKVVGSV